MTDNDTYPESRGRDAGGPKSQVAPGQLPDEERSGPPVSPATVIAAEGARIGIVICLECGAALLLDPRSEINVPHRHAGWHVAHDADEEKERA